MAPANKHAGKMTPRDGDSTRGIRRGGMAVLDTPGVAWINLFD